MINKDYFRVYKALVHRDFLIIKQLYKSAIIDAGTQLFVNIMIVGFLFPLMDLPLSLIAPIYIGTQTFNMLFIGMSFAIRIISDIKHARFIDYRLTLPLPKRWLFTSYLTHFVMEALIISFPLMSIGILLLGPKFQFVSPQLILFSLIYILSLSFYGLLFIGLSFYYEYDWFMQNLWPRRLSPLVAISPFYVTWHTVSIFSPNIAYLMLANPFTYTAEGMRATLIGGSSFISPYICLFMISIWIVAAIFFMRAGIIKRLDPV